MPKFRITVTDRADDWSVENKPLQSAPPPPAVTQSAPPPPAVTQSAPPPPDTPGYSLQSTIDTPGHGAAAEGDLSPLSD